jgi:hypothetical protein
LNDNENDTDEPPQGEGAVDAGPPIAPPTPLIDMRPLNPPGKIEEPVAGSGNPAMMGTGDGNSQTELGQGSQQ